MIIQNCCQKKIDNTDYNNDVKEIKINNVKKSFF